MGDWQRLCRPAESEEAGGRQEEGPPEVGSSGHFHSRPQEPRHPAALFSRASRLRNMFLSAWSHSSLTFLCIFLQNHSDLD